MINGSVNKIFAILIFPMIYIVSCNSLPPGNPPPEDQPIISDSPIKKQNIHKNSIPETTNINITKSKDKIKHPPPIEPPITEIKTEIPKGDDAVNFMIIMLATKCEQIATPEQGPPPILNEFTVSCNAVNDFPLQVWNRLINNSMIKPISDPQKFYQYILVSSIEEIKTSNIKNKRKKYFWKMDLLNASNRKQLWSTTFNFEE
jgi:hypothetical protein